jgi:hemerythrin-like domain-containing protein
MKRDNNLKTLSWEHHDGLVAAFRLERGLKSGTPVKIMAQYILHLWDNALQHHFWQEEQIVPRLKSITDSEKKINQMQREHQTFRNLIKSIRSDLSNVALVRQFAALLNQHIRFEERELFPLFESIFSKKDLSEIGDFLRSHHAPACHDWQPQFWQDQAVGV